VIHRLVGYDPETERPVFERDIPPEQWRQVSRIARVQPDDPEALAAYPLSGAQLDELVSLLGETLPAIPMDYFLEPFAAGPPNRRPAGSL